MRFLWDAFDEDGITSESGRFKNFTNTAMYSPVSYLPQSVGIFLGRLFSDNLIFQAFFGRITSFLAIGALLYIAMGWLPFGQWILFAVALLPIDMQECISLSADGFTFAVASALTAFALHLRFRQKEIGKKDLAVLYSLSFLMALCKMVYVPICLTAFLIPPSAFGSKKRYWFHVVCDGLMVALLALGWLKISASYQIEFYPGAAPTAQVWYILRHPISYIAAILQTFAFEWKVWLLNLFTGSMGALDIYCDLRVVFLTGFATGAMVWVDRIPLDKKSFRPVRFLLAAAGLLGLLLIFTSLYVEWSPYANGSVIGIQGRYFIPLLLPLILALKPAGAKPMDTEAVFIACCMELVTTLLALTVLAVRFVM